MNGAENIIGSAESLELAEQFGEAFSPEWRLAHAIMGDAAMTEVAALIPTLGSDSRENDTAVAAILSALALVATAHYTAANVRAKPGWLQTSRAKAAAAEDIEITPRLVIGHGQWPIEQTPEGRIVRVPSGLEVSPEELLSLANVGITLEWEKNDG